MSASRRYVIDKPLFKKSYGISPEDKSDGCQYVRIRHSTGSSPDLALHDGSDNQAPILCVAHLMKTHVGFKIGLGNPADVNKVMWEDMKAINKLRTSFSWSMELPQQDQHESPTNVDNAVTRMSFTWKKTRSVAVDEGSIHALSTRNWKLVDGEDKIMAVFTSNISRGQAGKLQVNVDFGPRFEIMVIMTLLALYERSRRQ